MKHLPTTILGFLLLIIAAALIPLDMFFSTYEYYEYDLKVWHLAIGGIVGLSFIFLDPNDISRYLKRLINKKIK